MFSLLFWHKILIPSFKCYCHEGLCMSQNTGSHKNSLNLLGEKYLNESHWSICRIRLLECSITWSASQDQLCSIHSYTWSFIERGRSLLATIIKFHRKAHEWLTRDFSGCSKPRLSGKFHPPVFSSGICRNIPAWKICQKWQIWQIWKIWFWSCNNVEILAKSTRN